MDREGASAWSALQCEDFAKAAQSYGKAIDLARTVSDRGAEAIFLGYLGVAYQGLEQLDEARQTMLESAKLARQFGLAKIEGNSYILLGELEREQSRSEQAIRHFSKHWNAPLQRKTH